MEVRPKSRLSVIAGTCLRNVHAKLLRPDPLGFGDREEHITPVGHDNFAGVADAAIARVGTIESVANGAEGNRLERDAPRTVPVGVVVFERDRVRLLSRRRRSRARQCCRWRERTPSKP